MLIRLLKATLLVAACIFIPYLIGNFIADETSSVLNWVIGLGTIVFLFGIFILLRMLYRYIVYGEMP